MGEFTKLKSLSLLDIVQFLFLGHFHVFFLPRLLLSTDQVEFGLDLFGHSIVFFFFVFPAHVVEDSQKYDDLFIWQEIHSRFGEQCTVLLFVHFVDLERLGVLQGGVLHASGSTTGCDLRFVLVEAWVLTLSLLDVPHDKYELFEGDVIVVVGVEFLEQLGHLVGSPAHGHGHLFQLLLVDLAFALHVEQLEDLRVDELVRVKGGLLLRLALQVLLRLHVLFLWLLLDLRLRRQFRQLLVLFLHEVLLLVGFLLLVLVFFLVLVSLLGHLQFLLRELLDVGLHILTHSALVLSVRRLLHRRGSVLLHVCVSELVIRLFLFFLFLLIRLGFFVLVFVVLVIFSLVVGLVFFH